MSATVRPEVIAVERWADVVAGELAAAIVERPGLVVCLPTGATPLPAYGRLAEALAPRGASTAGATVVVLDEYLGLPRGHVARCDAVLRRTVVEPLGADAPRLLGFAVDGPGEPLAVGAAAATRMDADIAAAGGLDLVVLGLGRNGHVGMNEPGTPRDAPTRVVALTASTREAARGYGADPPPTHGVTLGMAAILAAPAVWLLATGAEKAVILARTLARPDDPDVPASWVLGHPGLRILVDAAAAGGAA